MKQIKYNVDGSPVIKLDENGNPINQTDGNGNIIPSEYVYEYENINEPNWNGFRLEFSSNLKWITYGNKTPLLASRLETLALSDQPNPKDINNMLGLLFQIMPPNNEDLLEWQDIADRYYIPINFGL